jgi:S-(hydroxymethyl)glutathione dehydrogenase/alcohol dehydrogenase
MAKSASIAASAALLVRQPGALEVVQVMYDAPLLHEVRVRTAAAGLCHSDLAFLQGVRVHPLPLVPGHEGSGIVEAVGDGVATLRPGDHVVVCASTACGTCRSCTRGLPWLCVGRALLDRTPTELPRLTLDARPVHQFRGLSTFAEVMLVHERAVTRVDAKVPLDIAALLGCAVVTGAGSVINQRLEPDCSIAVIGCGGVGLNLLAATRGVAARRVIAVDLHPEKLERARRYGASDTVDASRTDVTAAVLDLEPGGVDHVFEVVGSSATLRQAFDLLAPGGTAYMVGVATDGVEVSLPMDRMLFGRTVRGLYMGSTVPSRDVPRYAQSYLDGELDLDGLVSHRVPLAMIGDAYAAMETGVDARTLVVF